MYDGRRVIDVHGHMSTPPEFRAYAYNLIAVRSPGEGELEISDEAMKPALQRHLKMMHERNVQMISPRPVAMMHWERPFMWRSGRRRRTTSSQCKTHPDRLVGIAQLPQNSNLETSNCLDELERCVTELRFVGAIVNPDPGGDRQTPGMNAEYWFPLYEKAQELDAPLIVHPSISRDPRIEIIPHSYQYNNLTEETLATLLLEHSNVFELFPHLRIAVCHCGGALSRLLTRGERTAGGGGQVGMAIRRRRSVPRDVSRNLFFRYLRLRRRWGSFSWSCCLAWQSSTSGTCAARPSPQ